MNRFSPVYKSFVNPNWGKYYRYGFNGKENDGETGTQDYGMRIYNPAIARFLSVDPLTSKFAMLTPYQFASNTPILAVDLDGLEARVYTDLGLIPHSFLSVIDAEGVIHVYTFGQYGVGLKQGETSTFSDKSAFVHLVGDAANEYINNEFKINNISVYEISAALVDKQKIIDYYSDEMKKYNSPVTSWREEVKLAYKYQNDGSKAVQYRPYHFTPFADNSENCSSVTLEGLAKGGCDLGVLPIPWRINEFLWGNSLFNGNITNVTDNEKKRAANFENPNIIDGGTLKEFVVTADVSKKANKSSAPQSPTTTTDYHFTPTGGN